MFVDFPFIDWPTDLKWRVQLSRAPGTESVQYDSTDSISAIKIFDRSGSNVVLIVFRVWLNQASLLLRL